MKDIKTVNYVDREIIGLITVMSQYFRVLANISLTEF